MQGFLVLFCATMKYYRAYLFKVLIDLDMVGYVGFNFIKTF